MTTILETFPDANPKSIQIGTDNMLHFVDAFGGTWCEYDLDIEQVELTGEIIDDDPIDALCDGCRRAAAEEDE